MVGLDTFNFSSEAPLSGITWRSSKSTAFTIRNASTLNAMYFLSRGSLATGSVRVFTRGDQSKAEAGANDGAREDDGDPDAVRVNVRVYYHTQAALDRVNICDLERSGGKDRGVGIFVSVQELRDEIVLIGIFLPIFQTPRNWHSGNPLDYLRFEVDIVLPPETTSIMRSTPKLFNRLETDYSNFLLQLGVLRFKSMDIGTSNAPIISEVR